MERVMSLGDLDPDEFRALLHRTADWAADYRATIERRRISGGVRPGDVSAHFSRAPPEQPVPMEELFTQLDTAVMPGVVHWGHPMFLGYFGSSSNGPALIGEFIAAALNVSAMTWRTSPAATELETVVLGWIRQMLGLPDTFTGVVYDTASIAVVHALAAAREQCTDHVRTRGIAGRDDVPVHRVYASDQAHSSIEKAMIVLGLGEENVVRVATDSAFRMDVQALEDAIVADEHCGRRPMAVVATAGTTSTTSVDPVASIAAICAEHRTWLHVDAAYGGAMALVPEGRWVMDGVASADSVVVNPHKWLFVPLDFSTLYVRRPDLLRSVFSLTPEYLRGDATGGAIDYMDYGLQLGRRFRALKAWMAFSAFGREGLAQRIAEHCRLARVWAAWVEADDRFRLAAPVTMAVVCFRFAPGGVDPHVCDRLNEQIVNAINASGEAYLTHTRVGSEIVMRVGIGNILTTETHLERAWAAILTETRQGRTSSA
ncbi:MAG: pyridoxal-dependent decarboxylase [Vicinamibacterales bacterium]